MIQNSNLNRPVQVLQTSTDVSILTRMTRKPTVGATILSQHSMIQRRITTSLISLISHHPRLTQAQLPNRTVKITRTQNRGPLVTNNTVRLPSNNTTLFLFRTILPSVTIKTRHSVRLTTILTNSSIFNPIIVRKTDKRISRFRQFTNSQNLPLSMNRTRRTVNINSMRIITRRNRTG